MWRNRFLTALALATLVLRAAPASAEPAQAEPKEFIVVTSNVIAPFFGVYYIEANVRASSHVGLLVNANHFSLESRDWLTRATAAGAGLAYHCQGAALRRWYVEAVAEMLFTSWRHELSGRTSSTVIGSSIGAVVGYRLVWDSGPVLDLGAGIARIHIPDGTVEANGERASSGGLTQFFPAIKGNVGWAF